MRLVYNYSERGINVARDNLKSGDNMSKQAEEEGGAQTNAVTYLIRIIEQLISELGMK